MDLFAMLFAVVMIAAAIAATVVVGLCAGGLLGAAAFAGLLWLVYRAFTAQSGEDRPLRRAQLNAFQQPLATAGDASDEAAVSDSEVAAPGPAAARKGRDGYRNRAFRKHIRRKMGGR